MIEMYRILIKRKFELFTGQWKKNVGDKIRFHQRQNGCFVAVCFQQIHPSACFLYKFAFGFVDQMVEVFEMFRVKFLSGISVG